MRKFSPKPESSNGHWLGFLARLSAGIPLFIFGWMKILGEGTRMNFLATLELASIPVPEFSFWLAALNEIIAGALLLIGWKIRVGSLLAVLQMFVALYVHLTVDFSQAPAGGPPHWLPVFVLFAALTVFFKGSGRYSLESGNP